MIAASPNKLPDKQRTIFVCQGTGCTSGKSVEIREALEKAVAELGLDSVKVDFTGCHGFCQQGPIAFVEPEGIFYTHVAVEDVPEIAQSHLRDGQPVERLFYQDPISGEAVPYYQEINFYRKQQRVMFGQARAIDPTRIEDYVAVGGYQALAKALSSMQPEEVIDAIDKQLAEIQYADAAEAAV